MSLTVNIADAIAASSREEVQQLQLALFQAACKRFGDEAAVQILTAVLDARRCKNPEGSQKDNEWPARRSHTCPDQDQGRASLLSQGRPSILLPVAEDEELVNLPVAAINLDQVPNGNTVTPSSSGYSPRGFFRSLTLQQQRAGFSNRWKRAMQLVVQHMVSTRDAWADRGLDKLPVQHCVRRRYNPETRVWTEDDVLVKMEDKPFANGAMRQCFAMKKQSTFAAFRTWALAGNCVAKEYMKLVPEEVYRFDVELQMDAKRLGEAYNLTNPPKKVDIMQCCLVRFVDRPPPNLFCVENAIEGDYIKYNSNSGFVNAEDSYLRSTPQAFSHFTFEHTEGQSLVVDIQGVDDLYTDPQIHTLSGCGYGDGNLGVRGMALFFRSHKCNELCKKLHLQEFERCEIDEACQGYSSSTSSSYGTVFRRRASVISAPGSAAPPLSSKQRSLAAKAPLSLDTAPRNLVMRELEQVGRSTPLAKVHLGVSRLYAEVVLLPDLQPNEDAKDSLAAGLFHLRYSAMQGVSYALVVLALMYANLEPQLAPFAALAKAARQAHLVCADTAFAWKLLELAAERGVRNAALVLARAAQLGTDIAGGSTADGVEDDPERGVAAERWYRTALDMPPGEVADEEELASLISHVSHTYQVRAEYGLLMLRGAPGLEPDPAKAWELLNGASEEAMNDAKGKLSMKYAELAAEAEALIEEAED